MFKYIMRKNSKFYMLAKILVIIGALAWGSIGLFDLNPVTYVTDNILKNKKYAKIVYILVGLAGVYAGLHRKTYLPFLGPSVVPHSLFPYHKFQEDYKVEVKVFEPRGVKVIYWAAEPKDKKDKLNYPRKAYGDYANSGVANIDETGHATLYLKCPQQYKLPHRKRLFFKQNILPTLGSVALLPKHVHYRVAYKSGILSRVKTLKVKC